MCLDDDATVPVIARGCQHLPTVNRAIEVPTRLYTDDGRVFEIIEWKPFVRSEKFITITAEMSVRIPVAKRSHADSSTNA